MSIASIHERLKQAQEETQVLLTIDGRPNIVEMCETHLPTTRWESWRTMDRYLDEGIWKSAGPGFQRLQEWVALHWNPESERRPPDGTVATRHHWPRQGETRLDTAAATRKLIAAARMYGLELFGRIAVEFAAHGMIEVHCIYMLKGPSIEAAKPLDSNCSLLPYAEALRKIDAKSDPGPPGMAWPKPDSGNVCALEVRHFERDNPRDAQRSQYASPLLKEGPEQLALLLGLVWGAGFRVFGHWRTVPDAAEAALPFRHLACGPASGYRPVSLAPSTWGPPPLKRPLAITELRDLATKFSTLPEQVRHRLQRAMARLRDRTERFDDEDRAIDLSIALSVLFIEEHETGDRAVRVPQRAAWLYADSACERRQTEDMLGDFLRHHSNIAHGQVSAEPDAEEHERTAALLAGADDVLRASLKTMIAAGPPEDWSNATVRTAIRHNPPRTAAEIPSAKSDSLSWSVEEKREIDQALEAVWRPVVEKAPLPPPGKGPLLTVGLAPELVEPYHEQGVPYVVVHPARLYLAHPKWPTAACEPLDERAEYYCPLDVARHTRYWMEAALHKGLVVFEAPGDAELYLPKDRDRWSRPLYSSHEATSTICLSAQPDETAGPVSPELSQPATDTGHAKPSAAEEQTSTPAPEFPDSARTALEREWIRLWRAFQHDVHVATNSLLYLLDAIHSIHLGERQRAFETMSVSGGAIETIEDAVRASGNVYSIPAYPRLRAFPSLVSEPLFARSAPGGPMEQVVFKGWIAHIFDLWDSVYRNQLKHETAARRLPGAIRPRQQVLGDFRHIRNNLLHSGIARKGEAANCEILRWFTEGERMVMRPSHVFDFLNQMGWLSEDSLNFDVRRMTASIWHIDRTGEPEDPAPALISVRPLLDLEQQDSKFRYGASIVFENGLFGRVALVPEHEETEAQADNRTRMWNSMTVDENGDLQVPGLGTVSAAELYRHVLEGERHPGPGSWLPPWQFGE